MRRFCLSCSAQTGRLVERVCPALERGRAAKSQSRKDVAERRRARAKALENARWIVDGLDLRAEWRRLCAMPVVSARIRERRLDRIELSVHRSSRAHTTGHAKVRAGKVHLGLYGGCPRHEAQALLAHELAHAILPVGHAHDESWRRTFVLIVCHGYGVGAPSELRATEGTVHDLQARVEATLRRRLGDERITVRECAATRRGAS